MSGRVHAEVKAAPKSSFVPVQTGLLAGSRGKPLVSQPLLIQAKLTISQPNDRYEQEADRVAEQVMRMPEPQVQRQADPEEEEEEETLPTKPPAAQITPLVQRQIEPEEDEEEPIQTKQSRGQASYVRPTIQNQISTLRGGGQPLPLPLRNFFEPRFGHDFSRVRVHADAKAAESVRAVNALAYTVGQNVVFGHCQYTPWTAAGQQLLAHELMHVVQNDLPSLSAGQRLSRAPDSTGSKQKTPTKPPTELVRPPAKLTWKWKDMLAYPLLIDVWKDVISKKLTEKEKSELRLKGTEAAAYYTWLNAIPQAVTGIGGEKAEGDFGKSLGTWKKYTEALEPITPTKDVIMDGISCIVGLRIDDYLSSDLFTLRWKSHFASVPVLYLLAQGVYSTVQAVKEPSEGPGELTPKEWSKHLALTTWLIGKIFKEHLKAPDFFNVGPLQLKTHPAFAATPFAGGGTPTGLTAESSTGVGEPGSQLKLGLTLNLPKIILPLTRKDLSAKDIGNLQKYRGWQGSIWFTFDELDPTTTMKQAGKLPESKIRGGTIFGAKGHLGLLEVGSTFQPTENEGKKLTSWFLKGGYGYSGASGTFLKKIGFTATYRDWKDIDLLAPRSEQGAPGAGRALRVTPFAAIETGKRHKFSAAAALSFVTGSGESFGLSTVRGDLSYTYMGETAPDKLPAFKIDLSGSLHRLDWWNPKSPLMWGIQGKVSTGPFFGGAQVMTGASDIPEQRAGLLGASVKARVPTAFILNAGYMF